VCEPSARFEQGNALLSRELARRHGDTIVAITLHPGAIDSELFRNWNAVVRRILVCIHFSIHLLRKETEKTSTPLIPFLWLLMAGVACILPCHIWRAYISLRCDGAGCRSAQWKGRSLFLFLSSFSTTVAHFYNKVSHPLGACWSPTYGC
jgi:hypothetical protein